MISTRACLASATLLLSLLPACGASNQRHARDRAEAQDEAIKSLRSKKPALSGTLVCVRRASSGPLVELFVTSRRYVPGAVGLLKELRIDGSVRARSIYAYGLAQIALAKAIRTERRDGYSKVEVNTELYTGKLECPRVHIEVGVRGHVTKAVLRWANAEIARYGAGRVDARYAPDGRAV